MVKRHSASFYRLIGIIGTSRLVTRVHPVAYRLTGGRWLVGRNLGVLNVIVVTVGRHSGRTREIPLYAFEDGDRLVVIGSNMGQDREPAWVGNLRAQPEVQVRVGRTVRAVRAREADGEERERLWKLAAAGYPGYEDYARWTHRRIPVVVLEPRDSEEAA
ncbi:MAG: nitroreductase family deazaflavin-dependent oxidoreductase [Chloroflexi bacterium]|nr:nitroreductase family deazaflavin-dependent oxidoreductase [Chloroflexota bacterium]